MESRSTLFISCLLWVAVDGFKNCEHVYNCAKNKTSHAFNVEFCPNRFPATTRLDFSHYSISLPNGFHYEMKSVIGYIEVYTSDSETPIYSGSEQKTCEQLKAKTSFIKGCPIPAHSPVNLSGAFSYTLDFKLPADHYRIHLEVYNEKQDLEVCMEISVEVYETDSPPKENNSTIYTPVEDSVEDPGEVSTKKPVAKDPAYMLPYGGAYDQHSQNHPDSSVAPLASSCEIWISALLIVALKFRA